MTRTGPTATSQPAGKDERRSRLAEALRANLARRKEQARSRRTGAADERPEGLAVDGIGERKDRP